jgi:chaperonin cofactor prefoldin
VADVLQQQLLSVPESKLRKFAAELLAKSGDDSPRLRLQKQLDAVQRKIARAMDVMLDTGAQLHDDLKRKIEVLADQRAQVQQQIEELPPTRKELDVEQVIKQLRFLRKQLPNGRPDRVRHALSQIIDSIRIKVSVCGGSEKRKEYQVDHIRMYLADKAISLRQFHDDCSAESLPVRISGRPAARLQLYGGPDRTLHVQDQWAVLNRLQSFKWISPPARKYLNRLSVQRSFLVSITT